MNYPCPYCSTTASRAHNLRKHLMGRRSYGGHEVSYEAATLIIENIDTNTPVKAARVPHPELSPEPIVAGSTRLLNPGHWRSLQLLEDMQSVRETLALYEQAIGHPVYLRPTAKGLTVMSLDPSTPAMVGVGGANCCIDALPPTPAFVASAALAYQTKVAAMVRESAEERHVIARIRAALAHGLALGGNLLFLHQEWRFSTSEKLDVLAVDRHTGQLVVIEAKSTEKAALHERDAKGRTAAEQAASYAALLKMHSTECSPFFQRLALALSRVYRSNQDAARIDGTAAPRCELWWPGGSAAASYDGAAPMTAAAAIDWAATAEGPEDAVPPEVTDVAWVESDTSWQRELRRRQSSWREARGYPMGYHDGRPLGSRLAMPDAEEKLWNFITPAVGELVRREYAANSSASRGQQKLYKYPRLFADLLSSQPLAFNLFGELALNLTQASKAARHLWPDRVERVTRIEFEWSPGRWNPRYLDNGTAADVAIFHTTPSGGTGIIFVETKYHEDLRGEDHALKPRYLEVASSSGVFLDCTPLQSGSLQQLWFDHLLVLATKMADGIDSALFVVAHPEINARCRGAVLAYQAALDPNQSATFEARTLEEIVSVLEEDPSADWARRFRERYLVPTLD